MSISYTSTLQRENPNIPFVEPDDASVGDSYNHDRHDPKYLNQIKSGSTNLAGSEEPASSPIPLDPNTFGIHC